MKKIATGLKHNFVTIKKDLFVEIDKSVSSSISTTIIIPHVCNNIDVFGGGFTAGIVQHYPIVRDNYHMLGPSFLHKNLGYTQFILARENK